MPAGRSGAEGVIRNLGQSLAKKWEWSPNEFAVAFALVATSGLATLPIVVTTLTWKWGAASYLGTTALLIGTVGALLMRKTRLRPPTCIAGVTTGLLLLTLAIVFSRYDIEATWDRGDALRVGVQQLLQGESPYAVVTNLGNPLSPMLGGILLAAPFVALAGDVYWMSLTWLAATTAFVAVRSGAHAALTFLVLMAGSPLVRLELAVQSDIAVNAEALFAVRFPQRVAGWPGVAERGLAGALRREQRRRRPGGALDGNPGHGHASPARHTLGHGPCRRTDPHPTGPGKIRWVGGGRRRAGHAGNGRLASAAHRMALATHRQ